MGREENGKSEPENDPSHDPFIDSYKNRSKHSNQQVIRYSSDHKNLLKNYTIIISKNV